MATITSATWLTEKYAMGDFKSIWRKHMGLVIFFVRIVLRRSMLWNLLGGLVL